MTSGLPPARALALAGEAHANVARARALLENPSVEALEGIAAGLSAAVELLNRLRQNPIPPEEAAGAARTIEQLRSDLERVRLLLRRAWEFRARSSGQAGYSRSGEWSGPPAPAGRRVYEA